jgi:hypothetical protein
MKRSIVFYFLMILTLISLCPGLKSQDLFNNADGERIQAWTDRTIYVSGEKVLFSAVIYNVADSLAASFSRTFYCELITSDGRKMAGGKFLLTNSSGQGCITIPEETISGIYFLKFYTRFMRNTGTDEYKYIMLKIINPFKTEVFKGNSVSDTAGLIMDNTKIHHGDPSLKILSVKKTFSPREEIRLDIKADSGKKLPSGLCLSVIPESTYKDWLFQHKNNPDTAKNGIFIPETRGISLSGQVIGKESGLPVPDTRVNLSIIGDRDILVVRTDSSGKFFFSLPDYNGKRDIFLCADEIKDVTPEILIDNDFCSRPVRVPSPVFTMDGEEMKAAYKLAVNARISSVFVKDTATIISPVEENNNSFYGEPSSVLVVDKYIDLPTLEDYFTELPVIVKVKKVKGKKQFRFFTELIEMSMYDPIVLVDWVPVNDIEKILAMSPREIDRIELVEFPYIKGGITFGGIISFVSKKNDFAGIDLPKSGTFVNYTFLEECSENIPSGPLPVNIPDSRNTVYWNPSLQINAEGIADISFTAPDTPGNYLILIRGMTGTGEDFFTEEMISIMKK